MPQRTISLTGQVLVCDILAALEPLVMSEEAWAALDKELAGRTDDRLAFDDTEVLAYDAVEALDEAGELPEPEGLRELVDESDVQDLAAAVRRGDTGEAEVLLDRIFSSDTALEECVQRGRYGAKARPVPQAKLRAA